MPRIGWTSAEEREFLTSFIPDYEACQVKKKYKPFWQRLNVDYFAKFPVIQKLYPGLSQSDLTAEQKAICSEAILKQQKRLKEWYRWQMNPRSRNAGCTISKKDLHAIYNGRSRVLKPYEVFAKLFPDKVESVKKERSEAQGIKGRQQLSVWHEVARELYQAATPEEIEAVKKEMEDASASDNEEQSTSPEAYMRYLKKLPTILDAAVTPAVKKAGVLAFITIVGPSPEHNGKIVTQTLQFGDKPSTPVFSKTWADHDTVFVEELARFARRHEFPPDICAARSLSNSVGTFGDSGVKEKGGQVSAITTEASSSRARSQSMESEPQKETPHHNDDRTDAQAVKRNRIIYSDNEDEEGEDEDEDEGDQDKDVEDDGMELEEDGMTLKLQDWSFSEDDWATFDSTLVNMGRTSSPRSTPVPSTSTRSTSTRPPSTPSPSTRSPSTHSPYTRSPSTRSPYTRSPSTRSPYTRSPSTRSPYTRSPSTRSPYTRSPYTRSPSTGPPASGPPSTSTLFPSHSTPCTSTSTSASAPAPPVNSVDNFTSNRKPSKRPTTTTSVFGHQPRSFSLLEKSAPVPQRPSPAFSWGIAAISNPSSVLGISNTDAHSPSQLSCSPSKIHRQFVGRNRLARNPPGDHNEQAPRSSPVDSNLPLQPNPAQPSVTASLPSSTEDPFAPSSSSGQLTSPIPPPSSLPGTPQQRDTARSPERLPSPGDKRSPTPPPSASHFKRSVPVAHPVKSTQTRKQAPKARRTNTSSKSTPAEQVPSPEAPSQSNQSGEPGESVLRRSGRASIPSRREEQLQLIGSNVAQASRVVENSSASDSAWFVAALDSLRSYDLGDGWLNMVDRWAAAETTMAEIKGGKGVLPVSGRPEEWQKWTSKTWHGTRAYNKSPPIADAAEFGAAVTKWWWSLQPSFRNSEDDHPLPIYRQPDPNPMEDPWAHLRQAGQNGLVTVILLMAWWGDAISRTSQWEEDSLPAWQHLVADITAVLEELIRTHSLSSLAKGKKRPLPENEHSTTAPKRKK